MLSLIHDHLRPAHTSLLYLVLPMPCLSNSRYLSNDLLQDLMKESGFEKVEENYRPGAKLAYSLWEWREKSHDVRNEKYCRKVVVREGAKRNNFSILLG